MTVTVRAVVSTAVTGPFARICFLGGMGEVDVDVDKAAGVIGAAGVSARAAGGQSNVAARASGHKERFIVEFFLERCAYPEADAGSQQLFMGIIRFTFSSVYAILWLYFSQ